MTIEMRETGTEGIFQNEVVMGSIMLSDVLSEMSFIPSAIFS